MGLHQQTAGVFNAAPASGKDVVKLQLAVAPEPGPLPVQLPSTCQAAADPVIIQPVQLDQL